jgi:hypothetical protein
MDLVRGLVVVVAVVVTVVDVLAHSRKASPLPASAQAREARLAGLRDEAEDCQRGSEAGRRAS